ncbi:uncharacterized protein VTP21DRAFT_6905 [Calcarisporiella thermophila]|uniref:uncharacterized protein n=1 Tax=Calcarisporiella thermophila TaxID=911321 RepID=UPI0037438F47
MKYILRTLKALIIVVLITTADAQAWINSNYTAEYDYIIVGGGSAGGLVAIQLAKAGFSTLLMEAGPAHVDKNVTVPLFYTHADEDPAISFSFFPNKYIENSTQYQGKVFYSRVGAFGGCSIHNALNIVYPSKRNFDSLVRLTGDQTFSESNMREMYFKTTERNYYPLKASPGLHGKSGWFPISYYNPLKLVGLASLNLLRIIDLQLYNMFLAFVGNPKHYLNFYFAGALGNSVEGTAFVPMNVDPNTMECGNFAGYILDTANSLSNFDIWTNTSATRVIIDDDKVARAVEYKQGKYLFKASPLSTNANRQNAIGGIVKARCEVIVSAGAFNTPQLLMLSRIGDQDYLRCKSSLIGSCEQPPRPLRNVYVNKSTGPYTFNEVIGGVLRKSQPNRGELDIFTYTVAGYFPKFYVGFSQDIPKNFDSVTQIILKAHTSNPGVVRLTSGDPFDMPDINFNYFAKNGDEDIKDFTQELREVQPGFDVNTDKEIENFVRKETFGHHACCTANLGADSDSMSILDGKFRVRGVKNLRVVDATIFPAVPGYFPVLFVHMLGLKSADTILADSKVI